MEIKAIRQDEQQQENKLKRTKRIELQLNAEEYALISAAARRDGLPIAAYIRRAALDNCYYV